MTAVDQKQVRTLQARRLAGQLVKNGMRCNCDLNNNASQRDWEPEQMTGHSWVCRIHKAVMRRLGLS